MADDGFNGTTVTFGSAIAKLRGVDYNEGGADVDVTSCDDDKKIFEAGIPEDGLSVELVGGTSLAKGDKGILSVAFNDGTSKSLGNAIVSSVRIGGSMDGEITSTVEFKPSSAAA